MITIKIKTPKDYWEQLKEWVKEPRQKELIKVIDYFGASFQRSLSDDDSFKYLTEEDKDKVSEEILVKIIRCQHDIEKYVQDCYPKYNFPT